MPRYNYGGQALIEGVLMRGRDAIAVAFRHPDGHIVWASEALTTGPHGWRLARAPFVRGLVVLYETLIVGTRWLIRSANIQASADGVQLGRGSIALMLSLTLALGVGVFFILPLIIASATTGGVQQDWVQHTVEGLVRVGIFLGYLALISRMPDLQRVFEYHGAEHKTISCYEAGEPLTPENAQRFSRFHPRCGTSFLLLVMIVAIVVFAPLGKLDWHWLFISRVLGIPIVAGLAFELIKWFGKNRTKRWARILMWPGIQLQRLTTREPDLPQLAVAIAALEAVLAVENPRAASEEDKVGMEVVA
jgi:uncharacterized protein YqhQ